MKGMKESPIWRRMLKHPMALVGAAALLMFVLAALVSFVYTPHNPREVDLDFQHQKPRLMDADSDYWLGTDNVGRDILSRTMAGARISLRVGILVVLCAGLIGSLLGAVAGYAGGWVDNLLMRILDIMMALPGILLAIVIVTILGPSLRNAMIAVAIVSIPLYARVMRAETLRVKSQEFVEAARALGASDFRILLRAILPNCAAPLIVQITLGMGTAILETAGLSYLGLGDEPSVPEWGRMIAEEFKYIREAWWTVIPPLASISLTTLGFNLLGDGLRDILDPRLRGRS